MNSKKGILFVTAILLLIINAIAQEEEKIRVPGFVYKPLSNCSSVPTTGLGPAPADNQHVIATDMTDVRLLTTSCIHQSEVHISIDKAYPNYLIASANTATDGISGGSQGFYYSVNGGTNWNGSDAFPNFPPTNLTTLNVVDGDPSTAFDISGRAFISSLQEAPGSRQGFFVINSDDQAPWQSTPPPSDWPTASSSSPTHFFTSATTNVLYGFDKEMIVVDNFINSPKLGNMYCVGAEFTDQTGCGMPTSNIRFFSTTSTSNVSDNPFTSVVTDLRNSTVGFGNGADVQTGPNGEVFVCWADYPNSTFPSSNIGFAYSNDAGVTWPIRTNASLPAGMGPNLYNGGVTTTCNQGTQANMNGNPEPHFGTPRDFNNPNFTGLISMNDFPSMAVDKGCTHKGRVYVAFPELDPIDGATIFTSVIAVSYLDPPYVGQAWSPPVVVSLSPTSTNVFPPGNRFNATHSFFPRIAVDDETGIVSVAYYCLDGLDLSSPDRVYSSTNTYVAYSSDGGDHFNNIMVSDVAHLTAPIPGYETYAGDYIGITAHAGVAYVAWMDNRITIPATSSDPENCLWQIYVSKVVYSGMSVSSITPNVLNVPGSGSTVTGFAIFQAIDKVIIPVSGTFQSANGSHVDIKACIEDNLRDGFSANSNLHVYIDCKVPCSTCTIGCVGSRSSDSNGDNNSSDVNLKPAFTSSQSILSRNVDVYPNPVSDVIYINVAASSKDKITVRLFDVTGNEAGNYSYLIDSGQSSLKANLSSLSPGMYNIVISDNTGTIIKRQKIILSK